MSRTTSINLGDHYTGFISTLTQSGRYGSASEAVRAALRLLELEEAKLTALQQALEEGEASGESDLSVEDIFQSMKARVDAE